ncbi:MAG: hypothetical protein CL607_04510 [Anaerolineaceae bacterium]|nr:hypothetical protein [Anaerolineaceae bacterium]
MNTKFRLALLVAVALVAVLGFSVVNTQVQAQDYSGHTVVLGYAQYITDPASGEAGGITYFRSDLGNGQLAHDFVYNDPRAAWDTVPGISYGVKTGFQSSDVNLTNQLSWFGESFRVWERLQCSGLTLTENSVNPSSPGLVANFFSTGVLDIGLVQADVTQIGFLGVSSIFPPGTSTLGVTYTLFWTDANGNLTDIDNNGKVDAALREIYYNDQYEWADNGVEGAQPSGPRVFDLPTVAIHEVGHGLSAAHFGNIGTRSDGSLVANPRASMNAIYGGTLRELQGRDVGSHCSNWAQWPNN